MQESLFKAGCHFTRQAAGEQPRMQTNTGSIARQAGFSISRSCYTSLFCVAASSMTQDFSPDDDLDLFRQAVQGAKRLKHDQAEVGKAPRDRASIAASRQRATLKDSAVVGKPFCAARPRRSSRLAAATSRHCTCKMPGSCLKSTSGISSAGGADDGTEHSVSDNVGNCAPPRPNVAGTSASSSCAGSRYSRYPRAETLVPHRCETRKRVCVRVRVRVRACQPDHVCVRVVRERVPHEGGVGHAHVAVV